MLINFSDAIKYAKVDIVPKTVVNMGGNNENSNSGSNTVMDTLLKFITIDKLGVSLVTPTEEETKVIDKVSTDKTNKTDKTIE